MDSSSDNSTNRKVSLQLGIEAGIRLDVVATSLKVSRATVVEHLLLRQPVEELIALLQQENLTPIRSGRRKMSIFKGISRRP